MCWSPRLSACLAVAVLLSGVAACASSARAGDPLPLYKAGVAKKKAGDLDGAEASFRACLAADAKYGRCHFSLGVLLKKKGDLAGAEEHFRAAIAAHPTWGQAHLSLGLTLLKKGAVDEARPELENAIADKDLEADDRADAWNALGVIHRQAGRWKDAVAAYDHALAARASDADVHQNKALALERLEDYAAMEASARQAVALRPDGGVAWFLVGRALAYQHKPAEAMAALQKATTYAPADANAWYALGEAAEAAHDKAETRRAFTRYLELAPAEVDKAPVRIRIERLGP